MIHKTMRALMARDFAIDALQVEERPVPRPQCHEILIRIKAASLNYRDLGILVHRYLPNLPLPYGPASDASGEVVEVGEDVRRFKVGDRAIPIFTQGWYAGIPTPEVRAQRTLGAALSGMLQEYVAVPAEDAVHPPAFLSDREAATLPIAAVTAWSTLLEGGVKAGDAVLVQGTGGVALFALQFAKLFGARVIALSSSDEKLARAEQLGADVGINYRTVPDWSVPVRQATATLDKSLASLSFGGFVGIVGFVAGDDAPLSLRAVIGPMIRMQGIAIGSRERFEAMNRAITLHRLQPVVDAVFPLDKAADAFRHMQHGKHFGKIVIDVS
jgi:NADPH:quinone reductase-like Zn-dependent oxidoreductase